MKKCALLLIFVLFVLCLSACDNGASGTTDKDTNDSNGQEHTHYYSDATCTQPATCSCGKTSGAPLGHEYTEATCTTPKTCTRCQANGGSALGHKYSEATCTTPKICNRCQTIAYAELGHDYTNATCTAGQICKRCEDVKGFPLGHEYEEATCLFPMTCVRCQGTKGDALGHTYVDNKCIRCESIDPESLPVAVDELHVINSASYKIVAPITDTYGYTYDSGIVLTAWNLGGAAFVTYNLGQKHTQLSGSIVAPSDQDPGLNGMDIFKIYVDDVCVFSVENVNRETAKIDFRIDVTNATKLRFECNDNSSSSKVTVAIVNAELTK